MKNFFSLKRIFPELISTNEKFLFEIRNKMINTNKNLSDAETKRIFTTRKYFNNDIFLTGIKNHILDFNNFKNQILVKIFGFDNKKSGVSMINLLVCLSF